MIRITTKKPRPETVIVLTPTQFAYVSEFAAAHETSTKKEMLALRKMIEKDIAVMASDGIAARVAKHVLKALDKAGIK